MWQIAYSLPISSRAWLGGGGGQWRSQEIERQFFRALSDPCSPTCDFGWGGDCSQEIKPQPETTAGNHKLDCSGQKMSLTFLTAVTLPPAPPITGWTKKKMWWSWFVSGHGLRLLQRDGLMLLICYWRRYHNNTSIMFYLPCLCKTTECCILRAFLMLERFR